MLDGFTASLTVEDDITVVEVVPPSPSRTSQSFDAYVLIQLSKLTTLTPLALTLTSYNRRIRAVRDLENLIQVQYTRKLHAMIIMQMRGDGRKFEQWIHPQMVFMMDESDYKAL